MFATGKPLSGDRRIWPRRSQEEAVERFYRLGVERFGDYHGGMLNFGLWTGSRSDYESASQNLVARVAGGGGLSAKSRLLDVACGMGSQDVFLARTFGCRSIDGIDVTWKHVIAARGRAEAAKLGAELRFHHGSAVEIPFDDGSFTHVLCIEGGAHFDTRERFLHEAFRVLAPGGRLGLTDYVVKRSPRSWFERSLAALARRLWHVPEANVHTADILRMKLAQAGFREIVIEAAEDDVIPGYYREGRKLENLRVMYKIRGFWVTRASLWIDTFMYQLFLRGILGYVFVFAEKPRPAHSVANADIDGASLKSRRTIGSKASRGIVS